MGVPEAKGVPVSMHGLITPGDVAPATVNRYLLPDERQVITVRKHPAVLIRPIISLILGLALAVTAPAAWTHGMLVGLDYVQGHAFTGATVD